VKVKGLYAITDPLLLPADRLVRAVDDAITGGARIIQYRDKHADPKTAAVLAGLCRSRGVLFLVNDDPALAARVDADGVHLGQDDPDLATARALLGTDRIIGISCYNELDRARAAVRSGADYVAFGSFFPSAIKPRAVRAEPELLRAARAELAVPIVAIGGITPDNGAQLVEAGADALAVINAVFGAHDIAGAAKRFARLFDELSTKESA